MKNDWRERKGLFFSLLLVLVAIWGYNFYQIRSGLTEAGGDVTAGQFRPPDSQRSGVEAREPVRYSGDFRDPFQSQPFRQRTAPVAPAAEPRANPEPVRAPQPEPRNMPPPLQLTGIVDGTAMLQGPSSVIHFVRAGEAVKAGEAVEEAHVKTVSRDHVVLVFNRTEYTLHMQN